MAACFRPRILTAFALNKPLTNVVESGFGPSLAGRAVFRHHRPRFVFDSSSIPHRLGGETRVTTGLMLRFHLSAVSLSLAFVVGSAAGPALATDQTAQVEPEPADAAVAPEPPARDYLVYFDFDETEIGPDAANVLDRVAQGVFSVGSSSVTLIGHADTAGPANYNQWLSERRAFAVREYLLGKGLAADMVVKGRGEEDPRVRTPDGVKEQENRRVEIQIN